MIRRLGLSCQARMGVQTAHVVLLPSCGGIETIRLRRGAASTVSIALAIRSMAGVTTKSGSTADASSATLRYRARILARASADSRYLRTAAFCSGRQFLASA
ncbi:Uncharacterised protein [Mycobacteroides abscessus]|nr:Uncharacterised protein [Mycobacteroides abscessus]